jgi:hypothetical protein
MSPTVANGTTSSSRRQGAAKRATTHRDNRGGTQSLEVEEGRPIGQKDNLCFRKRASQLNYMDIRKIMDRRTVQQKKGLLTDAEIQKLVSEWQDKHCKADLNQATIDREVKTMEEKLQKYNVAALGEVPVVVKKDKYKSAAQPILVIQIFLQA